MISDTHIVARNSPVGIDNGIAVTSQSDAEANATIRNSVVRGSIIADNVDPTGTPASAIVRIGASNVEGGVFPGTWGKIKCVRSFDANFDPLGANCSVAP